MIYRRTVKGNLVIMEPGAELPDGTPVDVETEEPGSAAQQASSDPFRNRQSTGVVEAGIQDPAKRNVTGWPCGPSESEPCRVMNIDIEEILLQIE